MIGTIQDMDHHGKDKEKIGPDSPSQSETHNVSAADVPAPPTPENFNPGWPFYTSFASLCIITLAVALDATSLAVALPVRVLESFSIIP